MEENSIDGTYIYLMMAVYRVPSLNAFRCIRIWIATVKAIVPFPPTHVHLLIYLIQENQELYIRLDLFYIIPCC
jgi:hypothetical protein